MSPCVVGRGGGAAILFLLGCTAAAHAASSAEAPLGDCTAELVREQFHGPPERTQIRALITRLNGADDESRRFGMQVGLSLRDALTEYAQKALELAQSGLSPRNVRVKFLPCAIADHDHARAMGQAAGADVVLWGQTFCDWRKPKQCTQVYMRGAIINSYNEQKASPNARMTNRVELKLPPGEAAEESFKTSLTVVSWVGLEADAQGAFTVQRASQLARAELPQLASPRPRMLLDFVLGLYAFRADRRGLAAEFFRRSQQSISAGIEGVEDLYRMMGLSYMTAGEPERGLQALQQALAICQPDDESCRRVGLHNLGLAEDNLGRKAEALGHYRESLALARKRGNRGGEATTLNNMGRVYDALGEKQKALEFYNQALPLSRQVGDRGGEATTLNNMGRVYDDLGEKQKALEFYNQALPLRRQVGDRGGEATTLNNMGGVYDALGEKQKALEFYNQALPLRRQVGDLGGEATTLHNMGSVYDDLGEKQKALEFYNQALPLSRQVGDRGGEATTLNNMGRVYDDLGEKQKALEFYNQALPLLRQVGNRRGEATTLHNLGRVYSDLGEKQKALEFCNQALPLRRQVGDRSGEAATLNNMGRVYSDLGEKQKALEFYNQALPLMRQVADLNGAGIILENMATTLGALGQLPEAMARYQEATAMYRRRNPPDLDQARRSLRAAFALALRHQQRSRALEFLREMEGLGGSEVDLARLRAQYLGQSRDPEAAAAYQKLLALGSRLPPEQKSRLQTRVGAGLNRSKYPTRWPECPGLVVTAVVADSQAARLKLAVGDILLRYGATCLHEPEDLFDQTGRTVGGAAVTLELWRGEAAVKLTAAGGELGIKVASF